MNQEYCFCTLAVGKSYRNCALLLALDLEIHAANTKLIVLTDRPQHFADRPNIRAFKHTPLSCKIYNDKRLAIAKALSFYDSCIFLDANVRIKERVPDNINFQSGIVAYSCFNLIKNFYKEDKNNPNHKDYQLRNKMFRLCQQVAAYHSLALDKVKFLFEGIFYVTKNDNFKKFIRQWEILAEYFESNNIHREEGMVIGLAAAIVDFPINYDYEKKITIFKDILEKQKIVKGQASYEENRSYFEELKELEHTNHSRIEKILKTIQFYHLLMLLKNRVLKYQTIFASLDSIPVIELENLSVINNRFDDRTHPEKHSQTISKKL